MNSITSKSLVSSATELMRNLNISKQRRTSLQLQLTDLVGQEIEEDEFERKYRLLSILGEGSTAQVYAAQDVEGDREVAIKEFDKASMINVRGTMNGSNTSSKETAVQRVRRRLKRIIAELRISQMLEHPNIIKCIKAVETPKRICMVHEKVEGCDLLNYLIASGRVQERLAKHIYRQIVSAVAHCHDLNLYHRDIKPDNIILTNDMTVKLIDFGLAEQIKPGEMLRTVCGTPLYSSPEMLFISSKSAKTAYAGGPADVWSLGIVLYAIVCGHAPFDDSSLYSLREGILCRELYLPEYLSDDVKQLLKSLLSLNPKKRPTAKEILEHRWFIVDNEDIDLVVPSVSSKTLVNSLEADETLSLDGSRYSEIKTDNEEDQSSESYSSDAAEEISPKTVDYSVSIERKMMEHRFLKDIDHYQACENPVDEEVSCGGMWYF